LTFNAELTPDRAADVVFGDTAQIVDWQCDIASILPLITLTLESAHVVRFQAQRISKLRANGMKNVDHASNLAARKPSGYVREVEILRRGMGLFEEADRIAYSNGPLRGMTDGDRVVREALWDVLEDDAREVEQMRTALRTEIQADLERLDKVQRQQLEQAERLLVEGLLDEPHERARILRESRRLYREVTSEAGPNVSCAVWAQYCWLVWQLTANEDDTMIPLEFAISQPSSGSGLGKALCSRLYAYLLARFERFDEAHNWAHGAASIWPSVGAFHERARYAAMSGRTDILRGDLEALVHCSPLGIVMAYTDPTFGIMAPELLDYSVREQMRLRQVARQEISAWQAVVRKSVEVRRQVPSISLPHDLTEGVDQSRDQNDEANFLSAAQQMRRASAAKEDLKCLTLVALNSEKRKRAEAIAVARRNIDAAMEGRDNWIKESHAAHEAALKSVRSILSRSNSKVDAAQRGCGWGMSSGCGVLAVYVILAFILSNHGVLIGPRTPWGAFFLLLSGLPVLTALIYHTIYSARRLILDTQVESQVSASSVKYNEARDEANEQFRERIEASKQKLTEEEAILASVEEALRIL
jgi:hypothetical protein